MRGVSKKSQRREKEGVRIVFDERLKEASSDIAEEVMTERKSSQKAWPELRASDLSRNLTRLSDSRDSYQMVAY
jgi:hypothetical protein